MKKFIITFIVLLVHQFASSQSTNIDVEFHNENLKSALLKVEQKSGYHLYFQEQWVSRYDSISITNSFKNTETGVVLKSILRGTNLNYFITDNKIILTQNVLIHNDLPSRFFGEPETVTNNNDPSNSAPVFYKEYNGANAVNDSTDIAESANNPAVTKDRVVVQNELKFIGKETEEQQQRNFTLSGTIKSKNNGQPIPNVVIRTKNNKYSSVSDMNGHYTLKLPVGLNDLEVSSIGFNFIEQQIIMYSNGSIDFNLVESVTELGEVVVSSKKNEVIKQTATGVTSIDIASVKTIPMVLGERDIVKAALTMPGIKTTGEGSQGFNVRGGKSDQNLVLLDNGVIYNPFHFFGFFSAINPYTIKSADIYKGSIPIEYGGRLSSVFDIKTTNGGITKLEGEGGVGPVTSNLKISTPIVKEKSSLMVGFRATYSGWILSTLDDKDLKDSKANFYDGVLKYHHKINENNNLSVTGYYSNDKFNLSPDSLYKYSNRLVNVQWQHVFSEKHNANFLINNSEYKYNIDYLNNPGKNFNFGFAINETQVKLKFNYYLNDKHSLTYGISSKLYNLTPGYLHPSDTNTELQSIDINKEKGLESAAFLGDEFKVSDKLSVNGGLRLSVFNAMGPSTQYTYDSNLPINESTVTGVNEYGSNEIFKTYSGLEYRVSARYFLAEDLSIKGGYDTNYQYIHLLSTNTTQSPTDTWKLSDMNIEPQRARQISLGIFKTYKEGEYEVSLEGYYKRMNNVLDYKVGAEMILNETIEREIILAKGKAYGAEFLIKKTKGDLTGWLGYTYSRAFLRSDSQFNDEKINNNNYYPANFDKPHDLSAVVNWKLTKRISFSGNFVYQTGRPITYPVGSYQYGNSQYTLYSNRNQFRIPDYYRLDIGVNLEGNHKIKKLAHSFWNFSVYNLLGRNNPYSIYFVTENGQIKAYKTSIFSIPVPTLSYNFKF